MARTKHRTFALLALLAALAFAASPVTALAHWLTQHTNQKLNEGSAEPTHAPVCKLCVGLAAGASSAPTAAPTLHLATDLSTSPAFERVANPTSLRLAFFRSRAPPQTLL